MKITLKLLLGACVTMAVMACSKPSFITVKDGQFVRNGKPYTYIGTNFWYGPILASEGRGGNMDRLQKELDTLKALGIENLRVLVGAQGQDGVFSRVEPTLETAPGVYNDTLLSGLDRFLVELGKRDMQAVLFLNNSWEWSGGCGQYMEWATGEKALIPLIHGYWPFMQQMRKFQTSQESQELFYNHVKAIVGRTNSITGKPYKEDPAIFAWQIGNEPRCFSDDAEIRAGFIGWLTQTAQIIKELDPNHLLSTGNEGWMGCEQDWDLVKQVNSIPGVDYMTIHIWPYNWKWADEKDLEGTLPQALANTEEYLSQHAEMAKQLGLPLVCEEFGFPRDGFNPAMEASTRARDTYYQYVFDQIGQTLQGVNFWGWSGLAIPVHTQWESGDPYTGDPAQEAQGLNGVYITDTTVKTIQEAIITNIKH